MRDAEKLSIMILCGGAPRHVYVANRIIATNNVVAVVQEVGSRPTPQKLLRLLTRPAALLRKLWRAFRDRRLRLGEQERRFFFGAAPARLAWPGLHLTVSHINHPEVIDLAERLQPDLIMVFGTTLIREPLLGAAGMGMINLHGGLSPWYRGADCTFWALHNGEPEEVGCTLHFIDAGIDTGGLLAHVRPEVGADDNEHTLFWKGVRAAAEALAELPSRLARGERLGVIQREKGRLYQVRERGWLAQRRMEKRLKQGLLSAIDLPRRIHWFVRPPES